MSGALTIEVLDASHDRKAFACGTPALDRYFREHVGQDVKRRLGNCFVAKDSHGVIAGYYTLAATSLPMDLLPEAEAKRLPHYPVIPATLIGRLAVDIRFQGRQIGSTLVIDAIRRVAVAAPASFAILVDAKDDGAVRFYQRCGFVPVVGSTRTLFLPVALGLKLFNAS